MANAVLGETWVIRTVLIHGVSYRRPKSLGRSVPRGHRRIIGPPQYGDIHVCRPKLWPFQYQLLVVSVVGGEWGALTVRRV
jgi:hypothetical protein